jgi:hypothetical protein
MPSRAMLSMLGVWPIMPCVYAPTFHIPMSSPKMTRMFGRLAVALLVAMVASPRGQA